MKPILSKCCHAEPYVHYGTEGTNCYICYACNQPCDVYYPSERDVHKIYNEVIDLLLTFRHEREWQQFHSLKNLACSLSIEANELLELFQWSDNCKDKEKLKQEIADIAIYLLYFCHDTEINLYDAIIEKIELNKKKYPTQKVKGNNKKYDEL